MAFRVHLILMKTAFWWTEIGKPEEKNKDETNISIDY